MSQSAVTTKIYSILQNVPVDQFAESLNNYTHYQSHKITPDILEMVWDRTVDGMLLTDSDGIIIAVNAAFCSLVNMEEDELKGLPFTVIYDRTVDRAQVFEEYKERVQRKNFTAKAEKKLQFNSGQIVFAEVSTSLLVDDAQEAFVLTEFRDISERKRWEQTVHQNENRYRSLFENSVLPMYESNIDGKLINANVALLRLLGYETFDELHHLNLEKDVYVNPEQRMKLFEKLLANPDARPTELELKKKDGSIITVLAHSRLLRDEQGGCIGFEGILEDITERTLLEQQILKNIQKLEIAQEELTKINTQKDKILAIVSHDLRSPFSSILGFCDLLKSEFHVLSDSEKMEYINYINDAALQQLNMVNSLLDWSRLETGRMQVKFQSVNLGTVASEIMITMLGLAKKKNIELRSLIPIGTFMYADEQLLRQLLLNLVGNALKFTPAGGTISIDLTEDSNTQLVVTVSDTGVGMPAEDLEKIFKVEEKYTRKGLEGEIGTGLGLPMCYEIMKKHQGSIEAESTEGKGTTFILTFTKQVPSTCKKIMIVDDQKGNRLILSRFMKRIAEDSEVVFAESGTEAIDLIEKTVPDLILTDYHMPIMNGLEFIKKIRNDNRTKNTPVILISGAEVGQFVQTDPMTSTLRKPVAFEQLKEAIEKIHL
ncbi:MAG: PAS domain S-box protein [Bacteroidota bacterium]